MTSKFGIMGVCPNPKCEAPIELRYVRESKPLMEFEFITEAESAIRDLRERFTAMSIIAREEGETPLDHYPAYVECASCQAIVAREEAGYFIIRLSGKAGDYPIDRSKFDSFLSSVEEP